MLHVTCDLCGKELRPGADHYVVRIEVFAVHDPAELTEADLDEDHMEAVSQLLRQSEDQPDGADLEPPSQRRRYDLCPECRQHYLRDPLHKETARKCAKETAQKVDFSDN